MKKLALLYFFIFSGCQNAPIAPSTEFLFPTGTYKQKVEVRYVKDGKNEEASFNAVLKYSAQEISMYCYVGFGYTLFKLIDNLKDPPYFVAGDERIEKNKSFFLKMYPLIKLALQLSKTDSRLQKGEFTLWMQPENFPVRIEISKELRNSVPERLVFENKDHFRFVVTNTSFEP